MEHSEALGLRLPRSWAASSEINGPRASLWAPGGAEWISFQGRKLNPLSDTEPGPNTLRLRPMLGQKCPTDRRLCVSQYLLPGPTRGPYCGACPRDYGPGYCCLLNFGRCEQKQQRQKQARRPMGATEK